MDDYVLARAQAVREAPAHQGMYVAPGGLVAHDLASALRSMIAEHEQERAAMRADKPAVVDGHSDGKRVRYVRHETAEDTLRAVLALIETGAL